MKTKFELRKRDLYMKATVMTKPKMTETNQVRIRKRKDKIYKLMKRLNRLTDDIPVYYSIISADDTNSDIRTVQTALDYYFHNTNNNSLIIVSSNMYARNAYLIASIGKPLPLPAKIPILEKVVRNIDRHIRVGNYNLTVSNLKDTIDDIAINEPAQVRDGFSDYNSQLVIAYSRLIYHDRNDFNFNVDNDYNHYRLLDVEKLLLNSIK